MQPARPITAVLPVNIARNMDRMNFRLEKLSKSLEEMAGKMAGASSGSSFAGISLGSGSASNAGLLDARAGAIDFRTFFSTVLKDVTGDLTRVAPGLFGEKKDEEEEEKDKKSGAGAGGDAADASKAAKETSKTQEEENKKAAKSEEDREKANAKAWAGIVGNAIKNSKTLGKIRKAFAIGGVVMDTARGIAKAVASGPFPLNLPAIAFATVTGAAQLAAVKGQAHDGLDRVPSTGTYLLEQGERVVDRRLNADLSRFLNMQNGASATATTSTTNHTSNTLAPQINLTIGDGASADAVYSNRGALESMIREIFADYALEAPFG